MNEIQLGILIDSTSQPAWVYSILKEIEDLPFVKLRLAIVNQTPESPCRKFIRAFPFFFYYVYEWIDSLIFNVVFKNEPDAFETKDISCFLEKVPVFPLQAIQKKTSDVVSEADLTKILAYDLDVAIRFDFRILKGSFHNIAKHGVWSLHHGDNLKYLGGPSCFWEIVNGDPLTGSTLQILSEELADGKVIYRSYAHTFGFSLQKNRNHVYWKTARFIGRKLNDLYEKGPVALTGETLAPVGPIYRRPKNIKMFPLLFKLLSRWPGFVYGYFFTANRWRIGYQFQTDPIQILKPPLGYAWADPFPIERNGEYFIFFEEYFRFFGKGHISCITLSKDGKRPKPVRVLERDFHLSYPFVFEFKDETFMVPEMSASGRIDLFKATHFPYEWKFEKTLIENVRGADATLFEKDGTWWMFVNLSENGAVNWDEVYLYHAKTPLGEWTLFSKSPIKSDVRSARSAGQVFEEGEKWFRPAQDSSQTYGYGIALNEIVQLKKDLPYQEVIKEMIPPPGLAKGFHTLNRAGDLKVFDLK